MPSRRVPIGGYQEPPCDNDYVETEGFTNSAPPPVGPRSNDPPVRPDRNYQVACPNSKNLIEVVGDPRPEPDPLNPIEPKCLQLCHLQVEGLGNKPQQVRIVGDRQKLDVLPSRPRRRRSCSATSSSSSRRSTESTSSRPTASGSRTWSPATTRTTASSPSPRSTASTTGSWPTATAIRASTPARTRRVATPTRQRASAAPTRAAARAAATTTTEIKNSNSFGNTSRLLGHGRQLDLPARQPASTTTRPGSRPTRSPPGTPGCRRNA